MKINTKWANTNLEWPFRLHAFRLLIPSNTDTDDRSLVLQFKDVIEYDEGLRHARVMFDRGTILCFTEDHETLCITLHLMPGDEGLPTEILCLPH